MRWSALRIMLTDAPGMTSFVVGTLGILYLTVFTVVGRVLVLRWLVWSVDFVFVHKITRDGVALSSVHLCVSAGVYT